MGEITTYANLNILFLIRASAMKIGNIVITYLGRPENVPDEAGIKNENKAKII